MNRVLTGVVVIMLFIWVGILNAEQKEITSKDGASMVLIPAGEFTLGSSQNEGSADERPLHSILLSAYYIDKYEVTVAQYRAFCQATGRKVPEQPSYSTAVHPVVKVSWDDATAYAQHYGKRLPTEAEWEKAARAGSNTRYCFGDVETDLKNYAWYGIDPVKGSTQPVGTKNPNAFILYDMHGNVWEWCSDWYDANYYSNSPKIEPKGPDSGKYRVIRGGSWISTADYCRSALRDWSNPTIGGGFIGFRCVSSP